MFRSGGQSNTVFSSQVTLVLIYRPIEGMEGNVDLTQPRERPVVWKRETLPLGHCASITTIAPHKFRLDHIERSPPRNALTLRIQSSRYPNEKPSLPEAYLISGCRRSGLGNGFVAGVS
ncbi:hypothetical protein TNCV_1792581 [Trichonephila clavipes]|nr:hypothetical protein TNCV_1792581 [Trichonephila clavipes]